MINIITDFILIIKDASGYDINEIKSINKTIESLRVVKKIIL